jgi:ubiquinone/menaquinone biosynthesis C-methylase UbiE
MAAEIAPLGALAPGARLLEVMPFGGAYTARLLRTYPELGELVVAELSPRNLEFVRLRVANEGLPAERLTPLVMAGPRLPAADASMDAVFLPQILEGVPEPAALLAEARRVVKPGGRVVVTMRNACSWFGLHYRLSIATGQVPNFGPYRPRSPQRLARWCAKAGLDPRSRVGISPLPSRIGQVWRGLGAGWCRLVAVELTPRS